MNLRRVSRRVNYSLYAYITRNKSRLSASDLSYLYFFFFFFFFYIPGFDHRFDHDCNHASYQFVHHLALFKYIHRVYFSNNFSTFQFPLINDLSIVKNTRSHRRSTFHFWLSNREFWFDTYRFRMYRLLHLIIIYSVSFELFNFYGNWFEKFLKFEWFEHFNFINKSNDFWLSVLLQTRSKQYRYNIKTIQVQLLDVLCYFALDINCYEVDNHYEEILQ